MWRLSAELPEAKCGASVLTPTPIVEIQGPGFTGEHFQRAYWISDVSTKRGAGPGLWIVKAIADTHGGRVWVESTPGSGSTFYLLFPIGTAVSPPTNTMTVKTHRDRHDTLSAELERVSNGVTGLDVVTAGVFFCGGVCMFLARTGAGKTILANQISFHHVASGGRTVYIRHRRVDA